MFDNTDDLLAAMQEALGASAGDGARVGNDGMIEASFTDLSEDAPAAEEDDLLAAMRLVLGTEETTAEDADGVDDDLFAAMSAMLGGEEAPAAEATEE